MAPMNKMSRYPSECKVYVGDLGNLATKQELEDTFSYYGSLRNVWVARNPPGFAFVEFEDARDAKDAIRGLNGRTICGRRARVEPSNGRRLGNRAIFRRGGGRVSQSEDRCYECGERGHYARNCQERDWKRGSKRGSRPRYGSRSRYRSRSRSRNGSRDGSSSRSRMSTSSTSGYPPASGRRNRSTSGSRKSSSRSRSRSSNRSRRSDRTKKRSKRDAESSDWSDSSPCRRGSKSRSTMS